MKRIQREITKPADSNTQAANSNCQFVFREIYQQQWNDSLNLCSVHVHLRIHTLDTIP